MDTTNSRLRLIRTTDDAPVPPAAAGVPDHLPRPAYVQSVRDQIRAGEYLTPDRLDAALDRMIDAARKHR